MDSMELMTYVEKKCNNSAAFLEVLGFGLNLNTLLSETVS
jgi:hypothetical protein